MIYVAGEGAMVVKKKITTACNIHVPCVARRGVNGVLCGVMWSRLMLWWCSVVCRFVPSYAKCGVVLSAPSRLVSSCLVSSYLVSYHTHRTTLGVRRDDNTTAAR